MAASAFDPHALLPLTVFDRLFERTTFVTGWLLEGTIDSVALEAGLQRLTEKWRMLAGRLQPSKEQNETKWFLRIPMGPLQPNYRTFSLTTATSQCPLSDYISMPLPQVSASLPYSVFVHPSTPRSYVAWEASSHPLTFWHITYFPASANGGQSYTTIGFSRSHGVFDGVGASLVMNALVAELGGKEWDVPSLPLEGLNVNPITMALEQEVDQENQSTNDYKGYSVLSIIAFLKMIAWHLREKWWRGADRQILLLPKDALSYLVEDVRVSLRKEHKQIEHVTTGDILVAWVIKTIYASGTSPNTIIHCSNLAAFRSVLKDQSDCVAQYAHNAFIPVPYPTLSVADIRSSPLHDLTNLLAASRLSLSAHHVVSAYKALQRPAIVFPVHPDADESLTISNVSASRILESDWGIIGAKRTICGYRYQLTPTEVLFTNAVYIAGRLDDGSAVLDVALNKARLELLTTEIQKLTMVTQNSLPYPSKLPL